MTFIARLCGTWGAALIVLPVLGVLVVVWADAFRFARTPWHRNAAADVAAAVAATQAHARDELPDLRVLHRMASAGDAAVVRLEADRMLEDQGRGSDRALRGLTPDELGGGGSFADLKIAALGVPDTLVKAYHASGNRAYVEAARDYVLRFVRYERARWIPEGFVWNDHAIAERIYVLADVWDALVRAGMMDDAFGTVALDAADRWCHYLASASLYTFRTNHGVAQNLALMHAALMFPTLPDAARHWEAGRSRFLEQAAYYVSDEGVVSEHSAGYHAYGVFLLGVFQRYLAAHGDAVPDAIGAKYSRALHFLARLRRADGSLPLIGDTNDERLPASIVVYDAATKKLVAMPVPDAEAGCAWYPGSGYAIWRGAASGGRDDSHLVIAWPRLPGVGHFRPMDGSVWFWARGVAWFTDAGYWGEDHALVKVARGWDGTDAPHFEGESPAASVRARLEGVACTDGTQFAALSRAAGSGVIERQVVRLSADEWLVVDAWTGNASGFRERWTVAPGVSLASVSGKQFAARSSGAALSIAVAGSQDVRVERLEGSVQPFAGWVWSNNAPRGTAALYVTSAAPDGHVATYWTTRVSGADATVDLQWRSASEWMATVRHGTSLIRYARHGGTLDLDGASTPIEPPPATGASYDVMRTALEQAAAHYGEPHRLLLPYRWKVTAVVAALFLLQVVAWLSVRRRPVLVAVVVLGGLAFWIVAGVWLESHYFAA